jgi:glycosyltransferase involved in cell wall biosynthesis
MIRAEKPLAMPQPPALSVVVPCYNEEEVLPACHARLTAVLAQLGMAYEIVYVNDGSRDRTLPILEALAAEDPHVAYVNLSRNFGKEIALTAGLDHARATEAVVVIDADLQDPPEVIPELVTAWRRGYDVAYAQRRLREGEGWLKKATAAVFYRLMQRIGGRVQLPPDTGDFRLLSRRALDALLRLREQHRFMKGLFAWIGFPSVAVPYDRAPRAAGRTKWNWWKLWNLSLEGITSFTVGPLKAATYLGLFVAVLAGVYLAQLLVRTVLFGNPVPGYPSLLAVTLFLGGVQMIMLGIIGEYLGRVFNETKGRPLYLVERSVASGRAEAERSGGRAAAEAQRAEGQAA